MGCVSSKQARDDTLPAVHERTQKEMAVVETHDGASVHKEEADDDDPYIIEYVLKEWRIADRDNSGRLSFHEVVRLLNKLNVILKESVVKEKFKKVDKDGSGELDFNEFRAFLEDLRTRPEVKVIFTQYSKGKPFLTEDDFLLFLHQEQYELSAGAAEASEIIKKFEHSASSTKFYFTGFSEYIASQDNSAYTFAHRSNVYQPMDQPFPHYFIASSHNTYLEGDQLKGNSSLEAYSNALKRGCRCVELDCWDGDDGMPIIYHGHTMTSKIKFRDVIQTVKEFGFETTAYPVILSLENHCSVEQQVKMAEILREILGEAGMLPTPFIVDQTRPLPSPEQLKHKVIIKGKMVSTSAQEEKSSEEDEEDDDDDEDDEDAEDSLTPRVRAPKGKDKKEKEEWKGGEKAKKPVKVTTAKELSDLIHLKAVHFGGFQNAKDKNAPWEISSFSEIKVKQMLKSDHQSLIEYNMGQTCRIYPKGTRFDSSNYMPINSWVGGCQVVALNYQTRSLPMWLNSGKFLDNGGSGYVLKPPALRSPATQPTDFSKRTLNVNILSGWQLPKESGGPKGEVIDPYVKVKMYGVTEDIKKYRTKVVLNNGFNPAWNEKVSFELTRADVAEIIFEVYDQDRMSKDDFIGYAAIPVSSVKAGYRSVHLYDSKSALLPEANLFVQLSFS